MAEAFQPRFVDLVRNITTTVGKGNFVLGPAAMGFASLSAALEPGDSFYYSAISLDKPGEREVGRGTLQPDGTVSRDPINGVLTHFTSGNKTIALIAAAEWFNGMQTGGGAADEISAAGTVADGVDDDRAALLSADSSAEGDGKTLVIRRGVHRVASDLVFTSQVRFVRGARLRPGAGVNLHFAQGYLADDWNHCFDISAAGSSVTGERAPNGYVTPQHFGADPTDASADDRPAIEAATEYAALQPIRDEYAVGLPVKFPHPGDGNYYVTRTRPIYVARTTHWFGETRIYLREYGGVEIRAADGLDAVVFAFHPGGASAPAEYETVADPGAAIPGIGKAFSGLRSRFSDLSFLPESGASVRQGFVHNAVCFFDRCLAAGFSEAGFHAHANTSGSMLNRFAAPGITNAGNSSGSVPASALGYDGTGAVYGNVNGSIYTGCYAQDGAASGNGGAHGFVAHGNNAGTIKYIGCDAAGHQGAGFLENSSVGCELIGCHSAQNAWKVSHGASHYICVKHHVSGAASEPGAGADWRDYWMAVSASEADSAWAPATTYHPSGGVNVCDANSRTSVLAHYTEGGIEAGVVARNHTSVLGGNAPERTPYHGELDSARIEVVKGISSSAIGFGGERTPGNAATAYAASLGTPNSYTGGRLLQFGDAQDNAVNHASRVRLTFSTTRNVYGFENADSATNYLLAFPGSNFSSNGRSGSRAGLLAPNGLIVGDRTSTLSRNVRLFAALNFADITDAKFGAVARGDMWFYAQPSAGGKIGAVCTAGGAIGAGAVLKEWGAIDA